MDPTRNVTIQTLKSGTYPDLLERELALADELKDVTYELLKMEDDHTKVTVLLVGCERENADKNWTLSNNARQQYLLHRRQEIYRALRVIMDYISMNDSHL